MTRAILPIGYRRRRRTGNAAYAIALLTALAAAWPTAGAQAATTYYVRTGGDDGNDGLTPATALASVRPAARMLREPGDRLIVGPGTYREGNIAPFGSGTPEAPIVLFGDSSGAATGDAPGPVRILPTNEPKATMGFYLRGLHDVVIDGFEIAGASDACIETRVRRRTGAMCSRIVLRNNRIIGCRVGMQVSADGDVELSGNHLIVDPQSRHSDHAIVVHGAGDSSKQLTIADNRIEDRFIGLRGHWIGDVVLTGNDVHTRARSAQFSTTGVLTLTGNRFLGPIGAGELYGRDVIALDNQIAARISVGANGSLEVRRNTAAHLGVRLSPQTAVLTDNTIGELFVGGGSQVELARNEGERLRVDGVGSLVATGNRFGTLAKLQAQTGAEVSDNQTGAMLVRADAVTAQRNTVTRHARVVADMAEVASNTAGSLSVQARHRAEEAPDVERAFVISNNDVAGELVSVGGDTMRLELNRVSGSIKAIARDMLEVVNNDASGIAGIASATGSTVALRDNRSRGSAGPGLSVIGAETATIERNVASDNGDSGLTVRRTARVVATGNELTGNGRGGISLRVPPAADCNEDVDVSIADLVTTMGVALQLRPRHDCDAADTNRDRAVTVDEVVLGVGAALGRPDPVLSSVELRDNRVEDNGRFGINVYARAAVVATGNRVLRNGGVPLAVHGLGPLSEATLTGNLLGLGNADGLFVDAVDTARVRDNVIFGNGDAGILLLATPGAAVVNNLVYDNAGPGIAVGIADPRPTTDVVLANNTIFDNGERGIQIGSGDVASTGTVVRDNIVHQNALAGVTADRGALPGLSISFNINTDGYGDGVPPGETDLDVDPLLVSPAGADGILGGAGFADDDFHLQPSSPAIDAGSGTAAERGITGSAVAGETTDEGVVDLGYHYGSAAP